MHKIGFLIVDNNTTGYYKDLFDKLSKDQNIEVNWVNIKIDKTIYLRRNSLFKKAVSFLNSKISMNDVSKTISSIISKNKDQIQKKVWTDNEQGARIQVHKAATDNDEGSFVANQIFAIKQQEGSAFSEFAILYRTNAQSRSIEEALRKQGIEYRIYGGLSFYQRKEIKDVLSYLRLIINPSDEEALKRIINFPGRGIGQTTIDKLIVAANTYKCSIFEVLQNIDRVEIGLNAGTKNKLKDFVTMIESFQVMNQNTNAFELAEHVTKASGLIREFNKDVLIIAQTAYSTPEDKEKALAAGCNNFISKPINKDELIDDIVNERLQVV